MKKFSAVGRMVCKALWVRKMKISAARRKIIFIESGKLENFKGKMLEIFEKNNDDVDVKLFKEFHYRLSKMFT